MKRSIFLLFTTTVFAAAPGTTISHIHVDQFGVPPDAAKVAVIRLMGRNIGSERGEKQHQMEMNEPADLLHLKMQKKQKTFDNRFLLFS